MLIFGAIQIVISQIPDFDKLYGLSYLAAAMSFIYSFITLGLVIGRATGRIEDPPLVACARNVHHSYTKIGGVLAEQQGR